MTPRLLAVLSLPFALGLAACSSPTTAPTGTTPAVSVVAAFYPLEWAARAVGGDLVDVTSLTATGTEPHDLELTPQQVAAVGDAELVVYLSGFQPAIDDAVALSPDNALDAGDGVTRLTGSGPDGDASVSDPHIWLDPTTMVTIVDAVSARLSAIDPDSAATYAANAAGVKGQLTELDTAWASGTATCASRDLVVSHDAFGYLAKRYDFTQKGISGLSPDAEPSPAKIAEITDFVKANGVRTIYYETLVDPKVAQTIAQETGVATAVLDPLEGIAPGTSEDYLSIMRTNLATVQKGQACW